MFGEDPQYQAIASGLLALQRARPVFPEGRAAAVRSALAAAFPAGDESAEALLAELGPGARRDRLHRELSRLGPDWVALYSGEGDAHPADAGLSEAQARATAAFLELAFDAPGAVAWESPANLPHGMGERELAGAAEQFRWLAAQALEWRFNRFDTAGLGKARAFYAALREAPPPVPAGPGAAQLAELIRHAFAATPAPAPGDMTGSVQGTEPFEYAVEFRGRDWRGLSAAFLGRHSAALSFFSPAAFRYFIPAYLIHHLAGAQWNADPVFALTHGFSADDKGGDEDFDWEAVARRKFAAFLPHERAAIAAFLAHCDAHDPFEQPRIREAL
ncbi:hypothetical protein EPO15_03300, partial [bacterium]